MDQSSGRRRPVAWHGDPARGEHHPGGRCGALRRSLARDVDAGVPGRSRGWLFLYPILVLLIPVLLLAIVSLVPGVVAAVHGPFRGRAIATSCAVILLVAAGPPLLWFGAFVPLR
jgi:hypothetical protein